MPTWRSRYVPTPLGVIRATPPPASTPPEETSFEPLRDEDDQPPPEATIVNSAVYAGGRKVSDAGSIAQAWRELRHPPRPRHDHDQDDHEDAHPGSDLFHDARHHHSRRMAWIGMTQPTPRQLQQVAQIFDLHPLAVEDAIVAHQRPKLERYNETLFVVLRPATYDDATETVKFGEIHAFIGPDFVITVRHTAQPALVPVRQRFENDPDLLARGPQAVLYGLLDFIVDGYAPVAAGLENDIDEIETQVFESDPTVSRRIYELSQEVMELQRAVKPLQTMLRGLEAGAAKYGTDDEVINALRDVRDHVTSIVERNDNFRQSLSEILQLNAILVAQTQNEEMKRLAEVANNQADEVKRASSWAAILFAPTIVAGAYGMNFDDMPELHWAFGYPFALLLMVAVSFGMWVMFKRKNWL